MALAAALPVILSTCQADKLVSPQPTGVLQLAPGSVADSAALGSAGIRGGGLEILPQGTTSLGFQLQKAQGSAWLTLTPANGSAPDTVTVALNPAGLAVGTYRDTIIASSSNSNATPLRVPVQFTVHPCREAAIPHDTLIGASLSNLDCASPLNPGHFARRYRFSAAAGDSLSFELQATGFNGVLRIDTVTTPPTAPAPAAYPPSLVETDRCLGVVGDPCLHYFLFTETRQYVVEVTSTAAGATGTFALSVHGPRTPVLPDTLVQRGVDSITAIPFGAVIGGPALTLRGWVGDPDGVDTLRLEVELQPVGTPFSNVATHTSGPGTVDRRAFVAVDGLLDDTGYHWQARTVDQTGRASAWLSADNNLETSPDFTVQISQPPDPPSGAGQYRSDETTAIPVGGSSDTRSVVVKASVSDPDPGDQLRLEVEVKPVGTAFTNTPSASSPVVANGATATVTVAGLNDGIGYHWQSRVVDQSSLGSAWTPFGGNGEGSADFTVQVPATALSFSVQPSNTVAGVTVSPAIQVRAVDAIGNTASSFNSDITLSIQSGPAGGSLTGTATVTASAGVAVFNNVQLPIAGTYTLRADAGGLTAISNGFTISPAAATVLVFTVEPVNTEATKVITPPVQVTARDQFGNTATGFTGNVMMTVAVNPGGATLGGTTTVSANAGVAAFSTLTLDKTGTGYRLRAAATGLTPDTSAVFDIFPAGATKLRFTTQPPSSVVAGATMSTVRVTVQDNVDNTVTTYTGPVTVALGANPGNTSLKGTTTVNAVLGVASFSTLSVDTAAAGYTLVATAPGLTGDTSSGFSVTAASPDHLAFVVQPTTTTAGAPITPSVQVAVHDQFGNLVTTFTNNITVALGNNPPGNGVLDGTKTVAASGGIATYPTLNIDEAGVGYTLVATRGGLTSATSVAFDIVHAPPTQLEYVVQPSSTAAGELITPAVQVRARDQFGNTATTFTANITIAIGNNPGGGALGGTTVQPADAGIATFAGLSIDKVGTGYTLLATATGLTPATSNAFNIGSGTAVKLAFQVQPSNTTAGATIAPAIQVVALDALNNVASDFTANIALAIGVNPPGNGVLDGPTSVAAVAGVATFNVDIDEAGTGYTLTASSGALQGATSNAFNITAGPPTKLAFTVQPSNAAANAVITPAVRVAAQDAFGNLVTTFAGNVTVAIGTNPPGTGQLDGPATVAAGGGVAIFNALDIDEAGTGYTLTASSGALTAATSAAFNITAGPATQLAFTTQPSNTTAGAPISPAVVVTARDQFGNTATGFTSNVTVAIGTNPSGGVLSGTSTVGAVAGQATFSNLKIDKAGLGYTLLASSGALNAPPSNAFDITEGGPVRVHFSVQPPASTTAGMAMSPAIEVVVQDGVGNTVTSYNGQVVVNIFDNPGSGTLSGTTQRTAVNGVATFNNLSIDKVGTGYTLLAAASGLNTEVSTLFTITAGAPTQIAVNAGNNQTATVNTAVATPPSVIVRDAFNNPVAGRSVTFAVTSGGGSISPASPAVIVTNASGIAALTSWTLGTTAGTGNNTLSATSAGLTGSPVTFTASATAGPATQMALNAGNSQTATVGTAVATPPSVIVRDAFNNPVAGRSVTFTVTGGGGTISPASPAVVATDAAGIAALTSWTLGPTAGTSNNTLSAASTGLTGSPVNFTASATAGAVSAAQSTVTATPTTITASNGSSQTTITVTAKDALGNPISGATVVLAASGTGNTLTQPVGTTNASGVATGTLSSNVAPQVETVSATINGTAITQTASVTVQVGAISAAQSTVGAAPTTITASNGSSQSTITVTVKDALGNPISGATVVLAATGTGNTLTQPVSQTNASGVATGTLSSTVAEPKTVSATANGAGITQTVLVTVQVGGVSASMSTVSASPTTIAASNGSNQSTITVTARDDVGNPISGATVVLAATGTGNTLTQPIGPTNASGVATGTLSSTVAEIKTVSATAAGVGITQTAAVTVQPGAVSASQSTVGASPSTITASSGSSQSTITVTAKDALGNPISGATVVLAATGTNNTLTQPVGTTNASGVATGTLSSTKAEAKTVSATISGVGITQTAAVTVQPAAVSAAQSTLTASHATITACATSCVVGTTASTITVTAKDQFGNPVGSAGVTIASTGANNAFSPNATGTADASGVYTATFSSTTAEAKTISATAGGVGITQTAGVTVQPAAVSAAQSTVGASPTTIIASNGSSQSTITVMAKDQFGNPISNAAVVLSATGTGNTLTQPAGPTNASGVATGTLSSTVPESKTVSATAAGVSITQTAAVTVQSGAVSASQSTVGASPTTITASSGTSQSTITITAKDAIGNPISGATVVLAATGTGNTLTQPVGTTNGSGVATGTLSSTVAESKTVSATIDGTGITQTAVITVQVGAVSASQSTVSALPTTITASNGTSQSTITVTAKDALGNPISGATVLLAATGTGNTLTQPVATTNASGVATGTLSSTKAEAKTVSATVNGTPITQTAGVTVDPAATSQFVFTGQPNNTAAGATITPAVLVAAQDAFGNTVPSYSNTIVLSIDASANPGAATLGGTTSRTASSGVATFNDLSINNAGNGYRLVANRQNGPMLTPDTSASFNITAGTVSAGLSTVSASLTTITASNGTSQSTITVTAKDALGNPISGATVVLAATGTSNTLTQPVGATNASGVATGTLSSTKAEAKTVSATISGVGVTQTAAVTVQPAAVSASQSTVSASHATITACATSCVVGTTASTITVTAKDQFGNPVGSAGVTIASTGSNNAFSPNATGTADASGVYTATFSSTTAEAKTISATAGGVGITPTAGVTVQPAAVSAAQSTVSASHATITACATSCVVGTTASTITVTAKDQFGNPVGSAGVTIASTGSNNAFSPNATGTADASGVYTATFTSTTAEAKTISATAGGVGITQTAAVTVQSGTVSAAQSTVSASPTSIPSGGSQSTITVTAKDQFSNPISGATVVISATGTGNTVTQPAGPTNASGVATGALSSTVAEVKTVSATAAGVDITQTVDVNVAVVASAVQSSLVVATDTIGQCLSGCAVGSDASRVTVTVRDGGGNPLAGAAVTLSSSANTRFTNPGPSGVTDGSGNFSADFTSSQATNKTISATANGVSITQTATVATMPVLVGAGDITDCTKAGDDATANQLDSIPGTVFTTGDNAYPNGTTTNFASCYDPTWGRHKSRTRPTPGNHDYDSSLVAAPYFAYFGSNAGTSPDGYYSYNVGNWHIIALNDNVPMTANSAQVQWLRADLNGRSNQCVLAYWHRPRYSSGPAGPTTGTQALWQALADSGADVVLWGHEHSYERLEKMDAAGAVSATGIRAIVVGTGGGETLVSGFPNLQATSLVRDNTSRGVLRLTLFPNSYRWEYLPASGFGTFTDSGSDNCN